MELKLPLSSHDHIRLAQQHITQALNGIDLDEAFRCAAFESRITQYGNAVATAERLRSVLQDLQQLQAHH
jgi:hypothetical protein